MVHKRILPSDHSSLWRWGKYGEIQQPRRKIFWMVNTTGDEAEPNSALVCCPIPLRCAPRRYLEQPDLQLKEQQRHHFRLDLGDVSHIEREAIGAE